MSSFHLVTWRWKARGQNIHAQREGRREQKREAGGNIPPGVHDLISHSCLWEKVLLYTKKSEIQRNLMALRPFVYQRLTVY